MRNLCSRSALAAFSVTAGLAVGAPAAGAAGLDQAVGGTAATALGISLPTPALFAGGLSSGATSTSTGGTLTLLSSSPGWQLTVKDGGAGAGRMRAAASGCAGSAAQLTNPLQVTVTPQLALGGVTSAGAVALSGSDQTVASGSGILGLTVFSTSYQQVVDPADALRGGCAYGLTATYTLQ